MTLYGRAGRQHGACSETFWASCIMLFVFPGRNGRVTGSIETLPESQLVDVHFPPCSPRSLPFAGNITDMILFLCMAWEQKKCTSVTCYHFHSPTLSLCLFIHSSLPNLLFVPFFYVSVLIIYFCKNVWPVLSQYLKHLFKRGIHVNYSNLRLAQW